MFINDQPYGLFGLIETYKDPWLNNEFGDGQKGFERGILYQGDKQFPAIKGSNSIANLDYLGDNETLYDTPSYKIKVESDMDQDMDHTPLMEFTKFLATAPTNESTAVEEWGKHIDLESLVRK